MPAGNVSYNVSIYRMLSAGQVSNSQPVLKLNYTALKKQDKNKIKCMRRKKILKKKGVKILKINNVFILL